jgi:hypothetical protein
MENLRMNRLVSIPAAQIVRLWRGEVRLPIAYWLIGCAGTAAFNAAFTIFPPPASWPLIAALVALLAYIVFSSVCIWRSAGRYSLAHPDRNWGRLARFMLILGLGIGGLQAAGGFRDAFAKQYAEADAAAVAKVAEMNKTLPMMIDASTRLDRVGVDGNQLRYNYTLFSKIPDAFDAIQKAKLAKWVCGDPDMRASVNDGASFLSTYVTLGGAPVDSIKITAFDCIKAAGQPS